MPPAPPPPGILAFCKNCQGLRVQVQVAWYNLFLEFDTHFFDIQFKNTYNLIFLGLKVPSERFFHKNFKTGLTF